MLVTDGRDMNAMMNVVSSQANRCYCNHPMEVLRVLGEFSHELFYNSHHLSGVEAARQSVIIEIRKVYKHYGIHVSARHISLIADAQTCAGALMSLDRHGINHGEFNTLAQAAFEELSDVLTKAAVNGKVDGLCDNTSRIMLGEQAHQSKTLSFLTFTCVIGREIRVGTGSFDLFLDRECHESKFFRCTSFLW